MSAMAAERAKIYLGWCPLFRKGEVCAIPDKKETRGDVHSSRPSSPKRMDHYRNQVLVMNTFVTFVLSSALWFFLFYGGMAEELSGNSIKYPVLLGGIFGLGYSIYQTSCYRKRLFKEGKLTLGYADPKSYKIAMIYYFTSFAVIYFLLIHSFGSVGFLLAVFSFGFSYLMVQWFWYIDIIRYERKHGKRFIWKPQKWRGMEIKPTQE